MARLYIFAEGQTEQTFANVVLKPHLAAHEVYLHNPILIAHAKKKGKTHRGGGRSYLPMKNDIGRFLKQEISPDVFFTTMIDLYAIHPDFPGIDAAEKLRSNPVQRTEFLENEFLSDIGDSRFIPFIQLHEYEAYLLTEPSCFEYLIDDSARKIERLQATVEQYQNPEMINDGQHTAPSKRIAAEFPEYARAKSTFGPQLAELVGLSKIRDACPHFNRWLTRLEGLAIV